MSQNISDAAEFREGKRVNGVAKLGSKERNSSISAWALFESISHKFVVERRFSHNSVGKDALPVPYRAARRAIPDDGCSYAETLSKKLNVEPIGYRYSIFG